jgi:hypothetical protein
MAGLMTGLNLRMHANRDYLFGGKSLPTVGNEVVIEFATQRRTT